jgi:hypothetical protein
MGPCIAEGGADVQTALKDWSEDRIPVGSGCPEMGMIRYSVFSNDRPKVVKLRS